MGKKIVWFETYVTTCKYFTNLTDEEAELFEQDDERFFEEVDFRGNKDLEWDKISDETESDFNIEEN